MSPNPQPTSQNANAQQKPRPNQSSDKASYGQQGKPSNKGFNAKDNADKECG